MGKIDLVGLEVNADLHKRFLKLPESARQKFLSNLVENGMVEILDKNPEMLQWYISNSDDSM